MNGNSTMFSARGRNPTLSAAHPMHTRSTGCRQRRAYRNSLLFNAFLRRTAWTTFGLLCHTGGPGGPSNDFNRLEVSGPPPGPPGPPFGPPGPPPGPPGPPPGPPSGSGMDHPSTALETTGGPPAISHRQRGFRGHVPARFSRPVSRYWRRISHAGRAVS